MRMIVVVLRHQMISEHTRGSLALRLLLLLHMVRISLFKIIASRDLYV
jgi:hypothetical protein